MFQCSKQIAFYLTTTRIVPLSLSAVSGVPELTSNLSRPNCSRRKPSPRRRLCHNSPNLSFRTSSASRGEIRNPVKVQYNHIFPGSRLASTAGGLDRDDELRNSLSGSRILWYLRKVSFGSFGFRLFEFALRLGSGW